MATYSSEEVTIGAPAEKVFSRLDNLQGLGDMIKNAPADQIPEDKRALLEQIEVTGDTIKIPGGPMGAITLRKTQSVSPSLIRLEGQGTPVPMSLALHIVPAGEQACTASVEVDLQIPAMLKPMVSGPLKKMTSEFANMLRAVPFT